MCLVTKNQKLRVENRLMEDNSLRRTTFFFIFSEFHKYDLSELEPPEDKKISNNNVINVYISQESALNFHKLCKFLSHQITHEPQTEQNYFIVYSINNFTIFIQIFIKFIQQSNKFEQKQMSKLILFFMINQIF